MAFTYDLANADPDIVLISRVRLRLGDQVEDTGVLPTGANLQDDEIALYLTDNADNVDDTVAALAEVLANHWAIVADVAVGPRRESLSKVSESWATRAKGGATGNTLTAMHGFFGVVSA